jgi:glycosyltransferase involved in cell wall biosynthesis
MTEEPMRVLRVYHSAVVSAWRRREVELRADGGDVSDGAPRRWNEGGEMVRLSTSRGERVIKARTFGHHPFLFVYNPIPLWRALRTQQFDLLDIHEEPASLATFEVLALARLARAQPKVVLYSAQNISKSYPLPFRLFEWIALRRAAAVHTCNEDVSRVLADKGFTGEVVNLGLGVDVESFSPARDAAEQSQLPDRTLRVGYVGRIQEFKGVFTLLSAIGEVTDASLTYVGGGEDTERLRAAIAARGCADRVVVRGFVDHDELPDLYRSFDVLVTPSHDMPTVMEQFGRVVVEAMAAGVPVVVSDSGALPEVVGDAGIVVPQGDARALAAVLEHLRDSPELRRDLRVRGRARANVFSWPHIARRQAALYRSVLEREVRPDPNAKTGSAA